MTMTNSHCEYARYTPLPPPKVASTIASELTPRLIQRSFDARRR